MAALFLVGSAFHASPVMAEGIGPQHHLSAPVHAHGLTPVSQSDGDVSGAIDSHVHPLADQVVAPALCGSAAVVVVLYTEPHQIVPQWPDLVLLRPPAR